MARVLRFIDVSVPLTNVMGVDDLSVEEFKKPGAPARVVLKR